MPTLRALPLSSVKSLSSAEAAALKRVGIDNTKELLEAAGSTTAERALAKKAGLSTTAVREAVNRADLLNVKGVGKETADLFENAGVNSAKELAQRNPVALARSLEAFVKSNPNQGSWLPSSATIKTLVENAKPFVTPPGPQPGKVRTWGEAQGLAATAMFNHLNDVLFSNHPDGAVFRTAILEWRTPADQQAFKQLMRAGVGHYLNVELAPGAQSGATKKETPTHYTWEGSLMGLYTEVQVSKATGAIDRLYIEID